MENEPLTGLAAVEAIGLAAKIGNLGASFDRRSLSAAMRTRAGRLRVRAGLTLAIRVPRGVVAQRPRETRARRPRRRQRVASASASPGRPSDPPRPGADS